MANPPPDDSRPEHGEPDAIKSSGKTVREPQIGHSTTLSRSLPGVKPLRTFPHKLKKPIHHNRANEANNQQQQTAGFENPWLFQSANFCPVPLPSPCLPSSYASSTKQVENREVIDPEGDNLSLLVPIASAFTMPSSNRFLHQFHI